MPTWWTSASTVRACLTRGTATLMAAGAVSVALPLSISARAASTGAGDAVQAEPGASRAAARPGGAGPCASRRTHLRCPDLIMSAPRELHIDRVTIPGHVLLRATSSVDSRGSGPLELRVLRTGPHGTVVYQAIYDRRGRAHLFRTTAHLTYKFIPGERYGYGDVGGASYWKLRHAAAFELWSIGAHRRALRLVRRGPKVDYCLRDLTRTRPSRHSPAAAMYPACSEDPDMRRDVLGTSVGWSDVYPYSYPEQWINVTGLRGRFAYVQIADPDDHLLESSKHDNVSETYISLPSGDVLGTRVGVAAP